MKTIFAMILVFTLYEATAVEIKVSRMNRSPGYSERYDLRTNHSDKVALDCQSFIQGLLFGPVGDSVVMLQEWECQELMGDMKKSFATLKKHCLEVDQERNVMDSHHTCQ